MKISNQRITSGKRKIKKGSIDFSEIDMLRQCSKQVLQTESENNLPRRNFKRLPFPNRSPISFLSYFKMYTSTGIDVPPFLLMEIDHDSPFQASASSASSVEDDDPELLELLSGLDFPHLAKQTLHTASAVFTLTSQTLLHLVASLRDHAAA